MKIANINDAIKNFMFIFFMKIENITNINRIIPIVEKFSNNVDVAKYTNFLFIPIATAAMIMQVMAEA